MRARPIHFVREKYGVPLSVDAADVRALPGFIQTDEPHALTFYELMFVTDGGGALDLDAGSFEVRAGTAFVTRPGQARRWRLRSPLRATVLFFEREFVDGFFADPSLLDELEVDASGEAREAGAIRMDERAFDRCLASMALLTDEVAHLRSDSARVLRAGLYQLLVWLHRAAEHAGRPGAHRAPARPITGELRRLLEVHFREKQRVRDYAKLLGVAPEHLSRSVRRETGTSASAIIHARIVLEAKRMLRYSDRSVASIAAALDFTDPSYFVRFFKRAVGSTPRAFRMSHFRS